MGNRLEGSSSFEHDGRTYHLALNNRVLLNAEDVLGYSALDACEEAKQALAMGRNPKLRTVVAIFYGALVQQHPDVTEDMAIDLFMDDDGEAQRAFKQVLMATDPPPAVDEGNARKAPAKRGTSKKSTAHGAKAGFRRKTSG